MRMLVRHLLLRLGSLFTRDSNPKVVFYHDVGTRYTAMGTDRDLFWKHMRCLRDGDVLCFDDGFRGIWDERMEFRKMGLEPIVFVSVRLVGQEGYLTWDEIRMLQRNFGFKFQCHTWSHQTLVGSYIDESPISDRTARWYHRELVEAKEEIEKELNRGASSHLVTVDALCFPVGLFNDDLLAKCRAAGYVKVYASYPGSLTNDYVQPRCLCQSLSEAEFKLVLKGGMNILRKRYIRRHLCH